MRHFSIIIISTIFLFKSCNSNNVKSINKDQQNSTVRNIGTIYMQGDSIMQFSFALPDTLYQNTKYNGKIIYKGILDTIGSKLGIGNGKSRFILYYMTQTKSIDYSEEQLMKNMSLDTIAAITNDTINLYDIQFYDTGTYYIDGIIEDEVYLDVKNSDKTRIITNRIRATHKVFIKGAIQKEIKS